MEAKTKAPKPRSRAATVKHSSYSRPKDIKIPTPILKPEPMTKSSCAEADANANPTGEVKPHQRHKFYFPLKDLNNYKELMTDENRDPSDGVVVSPIAKGWEARIFEKNREHVRKRNSALARAHSVRNWSQFEQVQNSRNALVSSNGWNKSSFNGAAPSRGNLKMSYYSEGFRKESDVTKAADLKGAGDLADFLGDGILRKFPPADLYAELMKFLSIDLSPSSEKIPLVNNPPRPNKTVSFAPETVFHERNLNSYFWRDILWRQRARRLNRQKTRGGAYFNTSPGVTTASAAAATPASLPPGYTHAQGQSQGHPIKVRIIKRRPRKQRNLPNPDEKPKPGFLDGIGRFVSTIFRCGSTKEVVDPSGEEPICIRNDQGQFQYEKVTMPMPRDASDDRELSPTLV